MSAEKVLPQSSYDRLRAACRDFLLWPHLDPDAWYSYTPVPDADYWEPVEDLSAAADSVSVALPEEPQPTEKTQ